MIVPVTIERSCLKSGIIKGKNGYIGIYQSSIQEAVFKKRRQ